MAPPKQSTPGRAASALQAVAAIERKFGAGAVLRLGDVSTSSTDVLQTGLLDLDQTIGIGGWPRGRICEVFGPESVGVSTLLLQTLAAAQRRGGIVALIDVDRAFGPEYARRLGCAVEEVFIAQPDDGPMALEIVDALVRSGAFDAVALDSVPALYPADKDVPENGASSDALDRARLLSEAMRRLAANIDRTRTVVLFGNRRTESAPENTTPGGRALRFYSSVRLGMQRLNLVKDTFGTAGTRVKVTSVKNKVAPPLRSCELHLVYGRGFVPGETTGDSSTSR